MIIEELNELTGMQLVSATDLVEATSDTGVFMLVSGVLKRAAVKLSKICNDLRLLSSGPQTGFGEIFLSAVQAGSSIMPGKVNPVIPEMVNQVAFRVVGADATVTMAVEAGQLQLNAFEPVVADALLESLDWLTAGCRLLRTHCVDGIRANTAMLQQRMLESISVVTGLAPLIGYAAAADLAKDALTTNRTIAALAIERGLLDEQRFSLALSPSSLAGLPVLGVSQGPISSGHLAVPVLTDQTANHRAPPAISRDRPPWCIARRVVLVPAAALGASDRLAFRHTYGGP